MIYDTKYAKITNCDVDGEKVAYYAEGCKGIYQKFILFSNKYKFPMQPGENWTCPKGYYVKVDYDIDNNLEEDLYAASSMDLVTDSISIMEHCGGPSYI